MPYDLPIGPNYGYLAGEQFGAYAPSGGGFGMPPAVVAAGIAGATTLGGALIGSGSQGKAAKQQAAANRDALQYQRDKDAEDRRRYERDYADRQRALAAKDATRRAIAKHYGIDLGPEPPPWTGAADGAAAAGVPNGGAPSPAPRMPTGGPAPAAPAPALLPEGLKLGFSGPASAVRDGGFLSGMAPTTPMVPSGPATPDGAPPEVSNWNDWSRYARL